MSGNRPNTRPFLSLKEAAAEMGMSVDFISRRIDKPGGPPILRRGKKIMFPREAFLAWAAQDIIP